MRLDIRLPLGMMFLLIGSILTLYGWLGRPEARPHAAGMNANVWCGLALVIFGFACLALAWRTGRKNR